MNEQHVLTSKEQVYQMIYFEMLYKICYIQKRSMKGEVLECFQ